VRRSLCEGYEKPQKNRGRQKDKNMEIERSRDRERISAEADRILTTEKERLAGRNFHQKYWRWPRKYVVKQKEKGKRRGRRGGGVKK
jgi:hypothetical protein